MYDVENIYVCEASLNLRGLIPEQLLIDVSLVDNQTLKQKLAEQDQLQSF